MAVSIDDVAVRWPEFEEIVRTLTLRDSYTSNVVMIGTTLLGLAAGVVGVFALLRKRSLVADALSHATLPGIALAFLAVTLLGMEGRPLWALLVGATATSAAGVACIQLLLRHTRLGEDAAIGIVLSVFYGFGIVLLSYIQSNASDGAAGLPGLIKGQAATMRVGDVVLMGAIAVLALVAAALLLKEMALVCFNDAFAKVDGWPVSLIDFVLMGLVVVVTVAGIQAVGLILVVALLIIPPVAARFWTDRLWALVVISGFIGALCGYLGAAASSLFSNQPAGAVIVLLSGGVFVVSMVIAPSRGVIASGARRLRLRLRIAGDHLLEHGHGLGRSVLPAGEVARLARVRGWSGLFRGLVLWSLRGRGMLTGEAGVLALTDAGAERGARVARNHAIWEQYLISYADIAPSHVDWSVDQVEHVLSESLVRELERELRARGIEIPGVAV